MNHFISQNRDVLIFGSLFLSIFVLYIPGISPSVFGGDSGDIILASFFGGVAHPPGYPLNTMIGWVFTHLPYSSSIAFKANVMASFLMAVTAAFLFLSTLKLAKNIYVAAVSALFFAFIPLSWIYAHNMEVFQLNLALIAAAFYFLIVYVELPPKVKKPKKYLLYLSSVFLGLAIFHHHTSALLMPAFLFLIFMTSDKILGNRKFLLRVSLAFFVGFLPYIFVVFAAMRQTPINWNNPVTLSNFIRLITRADYGTFIAADDYLGASVKTRFLQLVNYFAFVKSDFTYIGLLLCLVGLIYLFIKKREFFWFTILAIVLSGPFFLFYSSFGFFNNFLLGLWERFIIVSYFFICLVLSFGLLVIYNFSFSKLSRFLKGTVRESLLRVFLGCFLFLLPLFTFWNNYQKADFSDFHLGDWLGHDTLVSAEPDSIIFLVGDTMTFNAEYVYLAKGVGLDRKIFKSGISKHKEYREQLMRQYPAVIFPENFVTKYYGQGADVMVELINLNVDDYPIYSSDFFPDIEDYKWVKVGLLKKLVKNEVAENENSLLKLNEEALDRFEFDVNKKRNYTHFIERDILEMYFASYLQIADELARLNNFDEALDYLIEAEEIINDDADLYLRYAKVFFELRKCGDAEKAAKELLRIDEKDLRGYVALSEIYRDCFFDPQKASEYRNRAEFILKENSKNMSEEF